MFYYSEVKELGTGNKYTQGGKEQGESKLGKREKTTEKRLAGIQALLFFFLSRPLP